MTRDVYRRVDRLSLIGHYFLEGVRRLSFNPAVTEMAEDRKHWHVMIQAGTLRSAEAVR